VSFPVNEIPAWLQASAALVQLGFAFAIYRITKSYVAATKDIALSTAAQVELLRAGQSRDHGQETAIADLTQRAAILQASLDSLPGPGSQQIADRMMRDATLFSDNDLDALSAAAARLGAATAETAAEAVQHMRWLRDRAQEVRSVPRERGFDWGRFNWSRWTQHYVGARNALQALRPKP
jgi:hypothetical protein